MIIRSRHSDKTREVSFISWYYNTSNKEDFIVIDWGDLVYWQLIDSDGNKLDHRIIARDHAIRIIDSDDKRNTIREITDPEWTQLKDQFYDSPVMKIRYNEESDLKTIERELLSYISESKDQVVSTKKFAEARGFSVSTINDVAKSLRNKYLITTEMEVGVEANSHKSYTSYRCTITPIGNDTLKKYRNKLSQVVQERKQLLESNLKQILVFADEFDSFSFERKKNLIHMIENALRSNELTVDPNTLNKLKFSQNLLTRIIYYLVNEYSSQLSIDDDTRNMVIEYEKINSSSKKKSLTALHYSIRLIKNNLKKNPKTEFDSEPFKQVLRFLQANPDIDKSNQIKDNLSVIINSQNYSEAVVAKEQPHVFTKAKQLIAKGEQFKAIRYLFDHYDSNSVELTQLSSRLNIKLKENIMGILTLEEYDTERNKISLSLLQLIEMFENN